MRSILGAVGRARMGGLFLFCSELSRCLVHQAFTAQSAPARVKRADASSGDDVGSNLIFDERDPIAEQELSLLQPLQPQQIGRGRLMQSVNRRVEVAVLLLQAREFGLQFALVLFSHDL